ncbi:MAG: M56 family metallopeptidase [Flavobacteriales bacterium]
MTMDLLITILKVNVVFALLFIAYLLFLRNTTFFLANRVWLLGAGLIAWALPFIPWPLERTVAEFQYQLPAYLVTQGPVPAPSMWDVLPLILVIHFVGAGLMLARTALRSWHVKRAFASVTDEPFSFFGRIAMPGDVAGHEAEALHAHESAHVRMRHSYDVILFEIFCAMGWWNPLWRMAAKELRTVHEHQADAVASGHHPSYDRLLLARAFGVPASVLVNSFRSSNIKTRINMLHRDRSPRRAGLKYALIVPVLMLAFAAISWKAVPLRMPQEPAKQVEQMPEYPGGQKALMHYIGSNLKYPAEAKRMGASGKVFVGFVVREDGSVDDVSVKRSDNPLLNDEAMRVVRKMPKWRPGMDKGKAVPVSMVLPMVFQMADDK